MGQWSTTDPGRSLSKTVDWRIIGCYLFLTIFGWLNIFAAVHATQDASIFSLDCNAGKQFLWLITGICLAILILFVLPSHIWEVLTKPAYFIVLGLLVLVIFVGGTTKGSNSWFELGPVKFQPAELSKITTALMLATAMSKPTFHLSRFTDLLKAAIIIGVPMLTIVAEKETGSALVYVGFLFVLYREGLSGWYLFMLLMAIVTFILALKTSWLTAVLAVAAACAWYCIKYYRSTRSRRLRRAALTRTILSFIAGVVLIFSTNYVFNNILQPHQQKRIEVLLGMEEDLRGAGYNVHQSMIAIGSGGLFGKGYLNGTQTTYGFVPEQSTDFIFCTVGEEWGFFGCLVVIAAYALMIWWIIEDADSARERFTRVYGYCVASTLFMHLIINIGMTIGLMPVIGIPLPLFSYGGSSLWAFTAMIFIFLALNRRERKYF